jgi:hypothetical protein
MDSFYFWPSRPEGSTTHEAQLFSEGTGFDTTGQRKGRSYARDHGRFAAEAKVLPEPKCGFDPGTMSRQQICHVKYPKFGRGPINYLIGGGEEMQTTDDAIDRPVGKMLLGKRDNVHDSSVSASSDDHQTLGGIDYQGRVLRDVVFNKSGCG